MTPPAGSSASRRRKGSRARLRTACSTTTGPTAASTPGRNARCGRPTRGETNLIDDEYLWRKDGTSMPVSTARRRYTRTARRRRGHHLPRHHRAQARRGGDPPPELPGRRRARPDEGRLLARAGRRFRLVQLVRAGGRIFGDLPSPGHRYRLDEWGGPRLRRRRDRQGHHGELRRGPRRDRSRATTRPTPTSGPWTGGSSGSTPSATW